MEAAATLLQQLVLDQQPLAAETVLNRFPKLALNQEQKLEIIYLELVIGREAGHAIEGKELIQRFPELASEIEQLIEVDAAVHWSSDSGLRSAAANATEFDSDAARSGSPGFGDYQILEKIGQGGMGLVYRARDCSLNRLVAVKTINIAASLNATLRARFQSEAELSARLHHPNIVQIYAVGDNDGIPYFSMELVKGPTLADAIVMRPLEPQLAAKLIGVLARAIHYAHSQGVIHRDLKPTNILLAPSDREEALEFALLNTNCTDTVVDSELGVVAAVHAERPSTKGEPKPVAGISRFDPKIADFGLARFSQANSQHTATGAMLGTPSYMAPEQIANPENVGPASDVYALGAILYTVLSGRPPFHAASALEVLRQVQYDEPMPLRRLQSRLPKDLETICLKCLRKDPADRYASADLLAADLNRFLLNVPITARPIQPVERLRLWTRRNPSLATLILAMFCASMAMTALWWRASSSQMAETRQREKAERLMFARDLQQAQREYQAFNIDGCKQLLAGCNETFRHWEWHYLSGLCNQALWESPKHVQPALTTAISPDGRTVATGYGRWGHNAPQVIHVWDLQTQQLAFTLQGHPDCSICDTDFSPDGQSLLSAAIKWDSTDADDSAGVILWDLKTGQARVQLFPLDAYVARFHPDGQSFFVGSTTGAVTEHSAYDGKLLRTYRARVRERMNGMILAFDFDREFKRMAITSRNGDLGIWNLGNTEPVHFLSDLGDPRQVQWTPGGDQVMVGDYAGARTWYDVRDSQLRWVHRDSVDAVPYTIFSPDGLRQVSSVFGSGVEIREYHTGKLDRQLRGHLGHVRDMAFDKSGSRLVTSGQDGRTILWDMTQQPRYPIKAPLAGRVVQLVPSPVEDEIALAIEINPAQGTRKSGIPRIELRHAETLKLKRTLKLDEWSTGVVYSPDGQRLLVSQANNVVVAWNKSSQQPVCRFDRHTAKIVALGFTDQGRHAVSMDVTGCIYQWEPTEGQQSKQMSFGGPVKLAAFQPRTTNVAVVEPDDELAIVDYHQARTLARATLHGSIRNLTFSPSGEFLAVALDRSLAGQAHHEVQIVDVRSSASTGAIMPVAILHGHLESISGAAFSPDDQRIATVSDDETVRLFDVTLGSEVHLLDTEKGLDGTVAFNHDGSQIIRARSTELATWKHTWRSLKLNTDSSAERAGLLKAWHESQVQVAYRQQDWSAACFHCSQLIDLGHLEHLYSRGAYHAFLGDWDKAEEDLNASLTHRNSIQARALMARIKLRRGDVDAYHAECDHLAGQLTQATLPEDVNRIAWVLCLSPTYHARYQDLASALTKAIAKKKDSTYYNTLALVYYRAGNYEKSIESANTSIKLGQANSAPFDWLFIALCKQRQRETLPGRALTESPITTLRNTANLLTGKSDPEPTMERVRNWILQQEQKAAQNQTLASAYVQCRELELVQFANEYASGSKALGQPSKE